MNAKILSLFVSSFVVVIACSSNGLQAVDADQCRKILNESLIDFYLPSVDQEHGGYFEVLDGNGKFTSSDKFLTLQARQLWFFSTLAVHDIRREEALAAAHLGYQFLTQKFYDSEHGGYFAKVSASGEVVDSRKHIYPNAFVIYGLVEYYRATKNAEAINKAIDIFETLEKNCYDQTNGGYQEFFYADWKLITDPSESGYVGAINTKTYNSHLHILEAFAQLIRERPSPLLAQRLEELVLINMQRVKHPTHPCNIDGWTPDWKMIQSERNDKASYGHDVECAWLVLDAVETLKDSSRINPAEMQSWARRICDFAIQYGYDKKHGGFFNSGEPAKPSNDQRKIWWVQTEALVSMLTMHEMTGDAKYREVFDRTFEFTKNHHIAPAGGWWDTLNEDGSVGDKKVRTSMWQGAYHNGRAMLKCAEILSRDKK
ncbi:MAG: AGE family epimerase/isomerase [Planctomycetota bacterium]